MSDVPVSSSVDRKCNPTLRRAVASPGLNDNVVDFAEANNVPHDQEVSAEAKLLDQRKLSLCLLAFRATLDYALGRTGSRYPNAYAGRHPSALPWA